MQCTCPSVDNVQLIFTPRSAPNDGGNLHEGNRTVERYNVGQIQYFENGYVTNLYIIIDVDTGNCCVACHRVFFQNRHRCGHYANEVRLNAKVSYQRKFP